MRVGSVSLRFLASAYWRGVGVLPGGVQYGKLAGSVEVGRSSRQHASRKSHGASHQAMVSQEIAPRNLLWKSGCAMTSQHLSRGNGVGPDSGCLLCQWISAREGLSLAPSFAIRSDESASFVSSAAKRSLLASRFPIKRCTRSGYRSLRPMSCLTIRTSPVPLSTESPPKTNSVLGDRAWQAYVRGRMGNVACQKGGGSEADRGLLIDVLNE